MENKTAKPDNLTIVHIGVMILTGIVFAIFLSHFVNAIIDYNIDTHANYVKEYATIVRYEEMYANNGRRTYSIL